MTSDSVYKNIAPYDGQEARNAIMRLSKSGDFFEIFSMLTKRTKEELQNKLEKVQNKDDFQEIFFGPVIEDIIGHTTRGINIEGLDNISPDKNYIFISNHRDIILDSAILNVLLRKNGFKYVQSAIGDNLLITEWITDLVKLNSCFTIERGISGKEMLTSSGLRSKYIRDVMRENKDSIWIAQREGRTKDVHDMTQQSILKMFKMSGCSDFGKNMKELRIVPLSISYEWEPCDEMKTAEIYMKNVSEYIKTPEDDIKSMLNGLSSFKGRVNYHMGKPLDNVFDAMDKLASNQERFEATAALIDDQIHGNYKLWENNYIAYDIKNSVKKYANFYTEAQKELFVNTMTKKLDKINGNRSFLNNIYLTIYANPVIDKNAVL